MSVAEDHARGQYLFKVAARLCIRWAISAQSKKSNGRKLPSACGKLMVGQLDAGVGLGVEGQRCNLVARGAAVDACTGTLFLPPAWTLIRVPAHACLSGGLSCVGRSFNLSGYVMEGKGRERERERRSG
jgi:hypothetical protein